MAFLFRHYSDIDVTPSRLDLGPFTKEDQAAPQAVATRAPGSPADPAGRSASRDGSAVARAAVSPGVGGDSAALRGARGLPHGGPCPRPALRRQCHERLARHPAGLVTTETGRCVSNARPGPVRRLLAALPGSRRCRGKRGPHQRWAPAAEARSGRARPSDPRPNGRASDMLSQALREAPWSSPAAPPASPTLVLSTRLPTEPRGERPLPRLSPATPAGRADRCTRHVAEPPLGGTGAFRWASAGSFNALLCGEGRVRLLRGSLHLPEDVIRPGSRAVFSLNIAKFPSSCTFRPLDAVTRARRGQDGVPSSRRPDLSRRPVPWFPQEAVGL